MRKVINPYTKNPEIITNSVLKSISNVSTGQTPNGKKFYSAVVDITVNDSVQKNVRALMFEGNVVAGGGLDKINNELIAKEVPVSTRIIKTDPERPALIIVSHLTAVGNDFDDSMFNWDEVTEEETSEVRA